MLWSLWIKLDIAFTLNEVGLFGIAWPLVCTFNYFDCYTVILVCTFHVYDPVMLGALATMLAMY